MVLTAMLKPDGFTFLKSSNLDTEVVYFDTEQSTSYSARMFNKVLELIDDDMQKGKLHSYPLLNLTKEQRKCAIEYSVKSRCSNTKFFIIDGVRDLIDDINDQTEANSISNWLKRLASANNVHIMVALHENKGDRNLRGAVGTELANAVERIISVEKDKTDKNIFVLSDCENRIGVEMPNYYYRYNHEGLITEVVPEARGARKLKEQDPHKLADGVQRAILFKVFEKQSCFKSSELFKAAIKQAVIHHLAYWDISISNTLISGLKGLFEVKSLVVCESKGRGKHYRPNKELINQLAQPDNFKVLNLI